MKFFLPQALWVYPGHTNNGKRFDMRIVDGVLAVCENVAEPNEHDVVLPEGLNISPGWIDIGANFCDPGDPQKETLSSGLNAAEKGGYTHVAISPRTQPIADNKSTIAYWKRESRNFKTKILPIAALSQNLENINLAELFDLVSNGSLAFSDGGKPISNTLFLKVALEYAASVNAVVMIRPDDPYLVDSGELWEGVEATLAGIPGRPSFSEEMAIERLGHLIEYSNCKVHFTSISTSGGLRAIEKLKKSGLKISCDVQVAHIALDEQLIHTYDSLFKHQPPLPNSITKSELLNALKSGLIDHLASGHEPVNPESKICEFKHALPGISCIEATFSMWCSSDANLKAEDVAMRLSISPRKILDIELPNWQVGHPINATVFSMTDNSVFTKENWLSKSKNFPWFQKALKGKVYTCFGE